MPNTKVTEKMLNAMASQAEAEAATNDLKTMSPLKSKQQIDARLASQAEAEAGTDNEKLITSLRTKQQIDVRLASQAEAEAGTDNEKLITSLRTKQAIDEQVKNSPNEYTKTQNFDEQSLSIVASAVDWDLESNQCATVILTENVTFNAPTSLKAGALYVLRVVQDGTGSRTITWIAGFKWDQATPPVLDSGIDKTTIIKFYSDGTYLYGVRFWVET